MKLMSTHRLAVETPERILFQGYLNIGQRLPALVHCGFGGHDPGHRVLRPVQGFDVPAQVQQTTAFRINQTAAKSELPDGVQHRFIRGERRGMLFRIAPAEYSPSRSSGIHRSAIGENRTRPHPASSKASRKSW